MTGKNPETARRRLNKFKTFQIFSKAVQLLLILKFFNFFALKMIFFSNRTQYRLVTCNSNKIFVYRSLSRIEDERKDFIVTVFDLSPE